MRRGSRGGFLLGSAVAATLLSLASCKSPLTVEYEDRIAMVDSVAVPESVFSTLPFAATIWSSGPNLCWKKGSDDIESVSGGLLVTPHDRAYTGNGACAQTIARFTHTVSLRLAGKGSATISIQDREIASTGKDSVVTITRTVTIR